MARSSTYFFLLSLILLLSVAEASALKVSGRIVINFEPGGKFEGQVCIIPEGMDQVVLETKGPLSEHIELEETDVDLSEGSKCVPYKFILPEEMEPGIQKSEIRAKEKPPEYGGTIVALVSVGHQIWVDVPYPGKYLQTDFTAPNADAGEVVNFRASVTSKGVETLDTIKGRILVYNWNDELVAELDTNAISSLETQESENLYAAWNSTGNTVGDYRAVLEVQYDGIDASKEANFKLGSLEVRLSGHTEMVYKKGIVPFAVTAESYWSEPVNNVRAHVEFLNGSISFDTLTQTLQPWEKKSLLGYMDTTAIALGNHTANITLFFGDGLHRSYEAVVEVAEEPEPVVEQPGLLDRIDFDTTTLLLISTVLFALIAVVLVLKIVLDDRRKGKGGEKGGYGDQNSPPPDYPQSSPERPPGDDPPKFQNF